MIPTFFGALASGTITAGVATIMALTAWVAGSVIVQGNIFFDTTNNTTPGIYVDSLARVVEYPTTCTATGGVAEYSPCFVNSPFTTTGTLLGASIECGNAASTLTGDVSFKRTSDSGTGTVVTNLDNVSIQTGANVHSVLAQPLTWNPAESLSFATDDAPTGTLNTTRYDCRMWIKASDKYGT